MCVYFSLKFESSLYLYKLMNTLNCRLYTVSIVLDNIIQNYRMFNSYMVLG